jgi:hypothetical protein
VALNSRHVDKSFNDFVRQPLLEEQLSELGPGVSWIDMDGDGDDDLIVPDGAGGELAWYRNDGATFTRVPIGLAAGDLDFTMALGLPGPSGRRLLIGRSTYRAKSFADAMTVAPVAELTLSPDGRRVQQVSAVAGPDTTSIRALALADVDGDGDLDLFAGGRVIPGAYPVPVSSHLYRNENGRFVADAANEQVFRLVGLVSAALFTDVNGDGQPDLVLATEWGPLKLFLNNGGRFTEATAAWGLSRWLGGWKGVTAGDFDSDGRIDLVATNWGHNTPLAADSAAPLYLYVGNFGAAPSVDLIPARYDPRLKAIAPQAALSRLAWALPDLRQRIPTFAEYADAPIEKVIGPSFPKAQRLELNTLSHFLLLNRGDHFEAHPLPAEAQFAPAFAAVTADFNGDGNEDLFLGENFSQTEVGTPRFDAGRGLLLYGDGKAGLTPVPGQRSGIAIYGDQRGAAAADYDRDGRVDLAVSQSAAETKLYHNLGAAPGLRVRLQGPPGNPDAVGAALRVRYPGGDGPLREVHAGSNYLSEDGAVAVLGLRGPASAVWVRWPGGKTSETQLQPGQRELTITAPPR